jgi:hypothetical protein
MLLTEDPFDKDDPVDGLPSTGSLLGTANGLPELLTTFSSDGGFSPKKFSNFANFFRMVPFRLCSS